MIHTKNKNVEKYKNKIRSLLNREPLPLEISIYTRFWEEEEYSGKYSRHLLAELPVESSRSVKEHPKMLEVGDNYQMLFNVSMDIENTERYFAGLGAKSVGAVVHRHGGDDQTLKNALEPLSLFAYGAGIPILNIESSGISREKQTITIAEIGLLRNKNFLTPSLKSLHSEIWWVFPLKSTSSLEEKIKAIRLNEMMISLSNSPWLISASHVYPAGILYTLIHMIEDDRMGLKLISDGWEGDPEDILLGKNPGGFILCLQKNVEWEIKEVFERYDAMSIPLGYVEDDGKLTLIHQKEEIASIPLEQLKNYRGEIIYHNESERTLEIKSRKVHKTVTFPEPEDYGEALKTLLTSPKIQFFKSHSFLVDSTIRGNTINTKNGQPLLRLKGSKKILTIRMALQDYHNERDASVAAYNAFVRASRQVACQGAEILGASISFVEGNPEKKKDYFRFLDAVRGIVSAAKALKISILGENVQWNQSYDNDSPLVAVAGLLGSQRQWINPAFQDDGDFICILGSFRGELESSEYARYVHGYSESRLILADGEFTSHLNMALLQAAQENILKSAYDMELGGLAVALVKSALLNPEKRMGCDIFTMRKIRDDALLFGESTTTALITLEEKKLMDMERIANDFGVACTTIGRVREHGKFIFNDLVKVDLEAVRPLLYAKEYLRSN
ncbi:MAG: AIR synthase related protein [Candidatus Marinimicrobia bacterium]|nr:AIR synthase related protein [Candidatus Neomarinimicrobiota bacterium]MDD5581729.1 AIR synthase related protein [Candidatus Neomarinimicrobiota bacterium]